MSDVHKELNGLAEESGRAEELARRLVRSGPKAAHVSASETHKISEWIIDAAPILRSLAAAAAAAPQPAGESVEMSTEFTDSARGAIAWVLWHHQGGHSPIGQPLRFALGMGAGESLPEHLIADAKRWAESVGATSDEFQRYRAPPEPAPSAPAAGDALSLYGAAGRSASRAPADVDALDWITDDMSGIQIVDQVRIQAQFNRIEDDEIVRALGVAIRRLSAPSTGKEPLQVADVEALADDTIAGKDVDRIQRVLLRCEQELREIVAQAEDYDLDDMAIGALETGIESIRIRRARVVKAQQAAKDGAA